MPEGDTVWLAAHRLDAALAGAKLERADLRVPRYATVELAGRTVDGVVARGKHMLMRLDGVTLHTHFKMQGSWHIYRPGQRWRAPGFEARVVLETGSRVAVGFRMPVVELLPTNREEDVVAHLGPDLLGPDWDGEEALRRLGAAPARPVGEALIDQRAVAGWGNVYKSEMCFLRGVDPWTPVGSVADLPALVGLGKRLIEANRHTGNQITTGDTRPGRRHWVYGRGGLPCRRCGTSLRRADQGVPGGERVTFWCPSCQPSAASSTSAVRVPNDFRGAPGG